MNAKSRRHRISRTRVRRLARPSRRFPRGRRFGLLLALRHGAEGAGFAGVDADGAVVLAENDT